MTHKIQSIQASALRSGLADALKLVKKTKQPLIIKQRNVPSFVILDIDEYEDYLDSKNPELIESVAQARKEIREGKTFTLDEVFGKL